MTNKHVLKKKIKRYANKALAMYISYTNNDIQKYNCVVEWAEQEYFDKIGFPTALACTLQKHNMCYIICKYDLLKSLNDSLLYDVVSHEVAHVVVFKDYTDCDDHGNTWTCIHKKMGGSGSTTICLTLC
jgi:hypothetical protein